MFKLCLVLLVVLGGTAADSACKPPYDVNEYANDIVRSLTTGLEARNGYDYLFHFSPEVDYILCNGARYIGRYAVNEYMTSMFNAGLKGGKVTLQGTRLMDDPLGGKYVIIDISERLQFNDGSYTDRVYQYTTYPNAQCMYKIIRSIPLNKCP